ncbi:MAG: redox-sensitive transcriptional activator SoxR [Sphingomonadales bacterium]|nr:redox-sensitive transcriptional activator SoxR [Sphingomonadales bacterium]
MNGNDTISIGMLARRTGVAVSAIRFYEERGLLAAERTDGNQRRFRRADIRRLSVITIATRLGLDLGEIGEALATLPIDRVPGYGDWQRVSRTLRSKIDSRIQLLNRARSRLDDCIGCGCLSLDRCRLSNREDRAGLAGCGPRFVLDAA